MRLISTVTGFAMLALVSPASAIDWSGFYAGLSTTAGTSGEFWPEERSLGQSQYDKLTGLMGGVQAGYIARHEDLLLGVEADMQIGEISHFNHHPADDEENEFSIGTGLSWLATLRGRIGADLGSVMPYLTAGLAAGGGFVTTDSDGGETVRETHIGGAFGAGLEFAFTDFASFKGEYLYVHLPSVDYFFSGVTQAGGISVSTLRAGLNFHF